MTLKQTVILILNLLIIVRMENPDLTKGVIFIHQGNFLLTTSRWTLVIDITMDTFDEQLTNLKRHVQYLEQIATHPENFGHKEGDPIYSLWDISRQEVQHLEQMLVEFENTLSDLKSLIMITRPKRALFDAGGHVLKFLFGVATVQEFTELSAKIDTLSGKQQKITHILEAQASVLNQTVEIVKDNSERIGLLVEKQNHLQGILQSYKYAFYTGSSLRFIESAFAEFRTHLTNVREAIDVLGHGRLSSYFIPRKVLLKALLAIKDSLPTSVALIESPLEENLFKFYQLITVTSAALPGKLRIFAEIPLVTAEGFFDLYEIFRLPAFFPKANIFAFYQTNYPYIALSKSRQSYMLLEAHDLQKCKSNLISICSPEAPIFKPPRQTCEYALFLGYDSLVKELCQKRISQGHMPIFRRVDTEGKWIYSTPIPLSLVIDCQQNWNQQSNSKIVKLVNTGFITLPMTCTGHVAGVQLASHFQSRSTFFISIEKHLVVPPITDILNNTEQEIIKSFHNLSDERKGPTNLVNDVRLPLEVASISLRDIQKQLKTLKEMPDVPHSHNSDRLNTQNHYLVMGGSIAVVVTIMIIVICVRIIRGRRRSRTRRPNPINPMPIIAPIVNSQIPRETVPEEFQTLQVRGNGESAENTASSEDNLPIEYYCSKL